MTLNEMKCVGKEKVRCL